MLVSNDMVCLLMQGGHKTQIAVGDYQSSSLTVGSAQHLRIYFLPF